jgi:bacillopeptidase F (M6 metalloprotease family)
VSGTNRWFYPQNTNPYGVDFTYATSGTTNFWGYDQPTTGDYSLAMTRSVLVPSGSAAYLRFNHAYGFEDGSANAYDGGVLEYSTNGGATWSDAGSLLTNNGYNGTIAAGFGNPLAGRGAYVRESNGYISSRASLSSLAGQSVRFRFRIGTDANADDYGWFVDDIRIYTCDGSGIAPPGAPGNVVATAGNASAQLSWTSPASDGGSPVTNYAITPYVGAVAPPSTDWSTARHTRSP